MASAWEFDTRPKRFRDTRSGRFLSTEKAVDLRDGFQLRRQQDLVALNARLAEEELTLQQWEAEVQQLVRNVHAAEYIMGRGGLAAMTDEDWTAIERLSAEQWGYLRQFADDVGAGRLSEAQTLARARLYLESSRHAYERGRSAAFGVSLPAYPCDGSSECKSRCKCHWQLVEDTDAGVVRATWKRSASESCRTCRQRGSQWAPLVITRVSDRIAQLWRAVA